MDVKIYIWLYLCTSGLFFVGSVPIFTALQIGGIVYDVVQFGMNVIETVDKLKSDETPSDLSVIIDEINAKIEASTTEIITTITLQSKLDRIDDAVINIHSSLIDIKHILQATTKKDRDEYIRLFVTRFEDHGLIKHLRFLPELLDYNIPGKTGKLVDLFAEQSRCNMTLIYDFRTFYSYLISDGISLEYLYFRLSTEVSLNKVLNLWKNPLGEIKQIFETQEATCMNKFSKYAKEDVQNANDALKLWTDNKQRYTWKTSDVIFLKPYGTFQFLYHRHRGTTLFWHRSNSNKIAIFSDKTQKKPDAKILHNGKGKISASIGGEWDENAARNVGNAVENHLKGQGYLTYSLVVFFDGGEFASERIQLDKDSPVLQLSIDDVKMTYCYESGFQCKVDFLNWFGGRKSVNGRMRVFAYADTADAIGKYQATTGSSTQNEPFKKLSYIFLVLCVYMMKYYE